MLDVTGWAHIDMKCMILVLGQNMSSTRYYNIGPLYQMYDITDWPHTNIKYTILLLGPAISNILYYLLGPLS
jgi:hypothetical protein